MEENRKHRYEMNSGQMYSKNNQNPFGRSNLTDGNTAIKLQMMPNHTQEEIEQSPLKKPVKRPKKRRAVKPNMDIMSLFILCLAIGTTFYACVSYLRVQTNILDQKHQITKLEKTLVNIQNVNLSAKSELNTSLDLKYIYEIATSELGMVYPNEKQIIPYESNRSDYVKQYADIPEDHSRSILDKILNPK